jgi:hypothetical protein
LPRPTQGESGLIHCASGDKLPGGSGVGILLTTDLFRTLPLRSGSPNPVAGCSTRRGAVYPPAAGGGIEKGTNERNTFTYRDVPQVICLPIEYARVVTSIDTAKVSFEKWKNRRTSRTYYLESPCLESLLGFVSAAGLADVSDVVLVEAPSDLSDLSDLAAGSLASEDFVSSFLPFVVARFCLPLLSVT